MKIYIASNFAHRDELKKFVLPIMEKLGHEITSSWITDDSHIDSKNKIESAICDLEDVDRADAILYISGDFEGAVGRGKHFELGYALGKGKRCFAQSSNMAMIFMNHPGITLITRYEEIR